MASGPGSFATGSTTSVTAVNGVATFSNLVLNTAGSYTLSASDGSLTNGTSAAITVSAASAAKVVFQQVPTTGTAGNALQSVTAAVEDQFGNIVTTDNSTVTLSVASGPGSFTSGSTISVTAVNGIATFSNLVLNTAGSYTLTASDGSLTSGPRPRSRHRPMPRMRPANGLPAGAGCPAVVNDNLRVQVAVEDKYGNLVTSDNSTITLTLASGTFWTGSSTATAVASNGIATFICHSTRPALTPWRPVTVH